MKLIDVLCNLPTSLSGIVLCDWLELESVVFLDSAICTSYQRPMLLDLFQSQEFVLKDLNLEEVGHLQWMFKRNIKVLELIVFAEITDSCTASKYLQKFGCFVRSVQVAGCSAHDVYLLVAHCRFLTTLTVFTVESMLPVRELLRCNPNLQEVRFYSFSTDQVALFAKDTYSQIKTLHIEDCLGTQKFPWHAFTGPALESLTLLSLQWLAGTDITALTQRCSNLRWINTTDTNLTDQQLCLLAESCQLLTHFDITNNSLVTDSGILSVVRKLPLLRHIEIHDCDRLTELSLEHIQVHCASRLTGLAVDIPSSNALAAFMRLVQSCKMFVHADVHAPPNTFSLNELEVCIATMSNVRSMALFGDFLTDAALCLVGKYCARLERLNICNDRLNLSYAPLALMNGCPKLKLVLVKNVEDISLCTINMWKYLRPQLRFSTGVNSDTFLQLSTM